MTGIEFLLFMVLYTPRSASHGHDIITNRFSSESECVTMGEKIKKDGRDHYVCVPVAALPSGG